LPSYERLVSSRRFENLETRFQSADIQQSIVGIRSKVDEPLDAACLNWPFASLVDRRQAVVKVAIAFEKAIA
jgi:hypothetical protein